MALLEASTDNKKSWFELPTPAPENYYTKREHLEKSTMNANGYLNRDIIRRNRHKVFCGYNSLDGDKVKLFKDDIYKDNHLTKPDVLEMIDYLNAKLNYNLDYNTFDEKELIDKVVKLHE